MHEENIQERKYWTNIRTYIINTLSQLCWKPSELTKPRNYKYQRLKQQVLEKKKNTETENNALGEKEHTVSERKRKEFEK